MKFKTPEGEIKLRRVSDQEYAKARRMNQASLDICPTCGGREEYVVPGIKQFKSRTYKFEGEEHECDCQVQMALYVRYLLAGIGKQYMVLDWHRYDGDSDLHSAVENYIERWESMLRQGMGVTFSGKVQGIGKTWGAAHIGKELIKRGQRVFFVDFLNMVSGLIHEDTRAEMESRMRETTFLILDDIRTGTSELQNSLYAHQFEAVIRHRTSFNLPTFITTNLAEPEFEAHFPRIASLLHPKQIWLNVEGEDYRRSAEAHVTNEARILNEEVPPIV